MGGREGGGSGDGGGVGERVSREKEGLEEDERMKSGSVVARKMKQRERGEGRGK